MARPATPMYPTPGPCDDGALSYDAGAAFLGISVRLLKYLIARNELDVVYEGAKPRVLKRQLIARLEKQLEESRSTGARTDGNRTR